MRSLFPSFNLGIISFSSLSAFTLEEKRSYLGAKEIRLMLKGLNRDSDTVVLAEALIYLVIVGGIAVVATVAAHLF